MDLFKDEHGKFSTTRIVLIAFVTVFLCGACNVSPVPQEYLGTLGSVILLCLGSTAARSSFNNVSMKKGKK